MANEQNLIQNSNRSPAEKHELCSKGGTNSCITQRKRKRMKETMQMILALKMPENKAKKQLLDIGIDEEQATLQTGILYTQTMKALKGDNESAKFCRDTSGEYIGAEEQEILEDDKTIIYIPAKDIAKSFSDINRSVDDREYRDYYLEGGRGSTKSSFISEKIIELLENNPRMCAVALRKVKDTLKDSVYAQLEWAIDKLAETYPNIKADYKLTKSPLEITKLSTGQKIYFRGGDDYGKIKSLKPPKDKYLGIVWYEEFDQFSGMNEIRKINQSLRRGGTDFIFFYSYNTPASSQHFVNIEKRLPDNKRVVLNTDYRSVPINWLGQPFIDDAEYLKKVNERLYNNEYLGLETGTGGNVFENLELREIPDDEIETFDYIYQGLDFGYFPDPLAWTKCCYNPSTQTIYIYDEFVVNKMGNEEVWRHLQEDKGVTTEDTIIADSAEPKSIGDFRSYGSAMRGAEKGPGSVDYSLKWLSSRAKIIIDPKRCPTTAQEFSTYEYQQDKDGNYITGYVDADNHCIDSIRYALNNVWKRRGQ